MQIKTEFQPQHYFFFKDDVLKYQINNKVIYNERRERREKVSEDYRIFQIYAENYQKQNSSRTQIVVNKYWT